LQIASPLFHFHFFRARFRARACMKFVRRLFSERFFGAHLNYLRLRSSTP
jgi:hypothetical protein